MIKVRRLDEQEYPLLSGIEDGFVPPPRESIAIIAENTSKVGGRVLGVRPWHLERIWIDKPWRNGILMQRLVSAAELELCAMGVSTVMAYAKDAEMEDFIHRLGYIRVPVTVWGKQLCR